MASNNGRETYNLGETKKATKPKEVKTNLNLNKETNWGSGEYEDVYGGHNYRYRMLITTLKYIKTHQYYQNKKTTNKKIVKIS